MKVFFAYVTTIFMLLTNDHFSKYRLTLNAVDQDGNRHTLVFGIDPSATYGYERNLDEKSIPPSPPYGIFDFRFKDIPGKRRIPSEGSYIDIREAKNTAQCDTFIVYCQASNNRYPMSITLDGDSELCTDSIIVEPLSAVSKSKIDLRKMKKFSVASDSENMLRIILYSRSYNE